MASALSSEGSVAVDMIVANIVILHRMILDLAFSRHRSTVAAFARMLELGPDGHHRQCRRILSTRQYILDKYESHFWVRFHYFMAFKNARLVVWRLRH